LQYGFSDPAKGGRATRPDIDDGVAPPTTLALVAEIVGERKRVLDLGCGAGELAQVLSRRECDIVGIDVNPVAVEEARKYCTRAVVADVDGASLSELIGEQAFDVIVLSDVIQYLRQPTRLLDGARDLLCEGGCVVAVIPNVSHGAIRLALLGGQFDRHDDSNDEAGLGHFTAKTIDELFLSAGYRIDSLVRASLPIFDQTDSVPRIEREDFDPAVVAEIERDPESQTLQFVVRAIPLTNDAKHRAIAKRFLTTNTELSATFARLEKRDREIERLTATATQFESELAQTRERLAAASNEARIGRATLDDVTADNRLPDLLERAHRAEIEAARLHERLAAASDVKSDLARALDEREALRGQLVTVGAQLDQFRQALTSERESASDALRTAKAQFESALTSSQASLGRAIEALETSQSDLTRVTAELEERNALMASAQAALQASLLAKDDEVATMLARTAQLESEIVSLPARLQRALSELDAAQSLARESSDLLAVADAEIAQHTAEVQRYAARAAQADEAAAALAEALANALAETPANAAGRQEQAEEIVRLNVALTSERSSAELFTEQLYDEILLLHESRAKAYADAAEARTFVERDIVPLEEKIARLEEERDAERGARIAGDELHDGLRKALTESRVRAEALEGAEERLRLLERRFGDQTQALLDQTRAEAERTALLIETVQGSVFWKLKRAFGRLRGR